MLLIGSYWIEKSYIQEVNLWLTSVRVYCHFKILHKQPSRPKRNWQLQVQLKIDINAPHAGKDLISDIFIWVNLSLAILTEN